MSSHQEPVAKKRQKAYDADGPVEEDEAAREKLREAGFDPWVAMAWLLANPI